MGKTYTLPEAFLNSFRPYITFPEQDLLAALQEDAIVSIRVNRHKALPSLPLTDLVPWCTDGFYLTERPSFIADPAWHAGAYYVQEASSMFLHHILREHIQTNRPLFVLDLCASPGGKSTLAASLLTPDSLLLSNEVVPARVAPLAENMVKWGQVNTWVSSSDAAAFRALPHEVDVMLVDAPCSGSGLFRKIPEYVNQWHAGMLSVCAQRQKKILEDAWPCLKPGGLLVYMTCSFSEEENELITDFILEQFPVQSVQINKPSNWQIVETESPVKHGYGYRFFPNLVRGEGFYVSVFQSIETKVRSPKKLSAQTSKERSVSGIDLLRPLEQLQQHILIQQEEQLFVLHEAHRSRWTRLSQALRMTRKGVLAGKLVHSVFQPDHELAMYHGLTLAAPRYSFSREQALHYLARENPVLQEAPPGWLLACYEQQVLGWMKHLGTRTNNYYPAGYRIQNRQILTRED